MTLAYQAMPYIERHLPVFEQLKTPWCWVIVHGPANNGGSTAWCRPQQSGVSIDGTTEYVLSIKHPNVRTIGMRLWESKDAMVNCALDQMTEDGVLVEVDADEIWTADQLEEIVRLFQDFPQVGSMRFNCNYFVGPDLVAVGQDAWGGNDNSWLRAWRYTPGMKFLKHEPPVLEGSTGYCMTRHETARCGLVFDHFSYATESQVAYKASFYGPAYANAVEGWRRLQECAKDITVPMPLRLFFPWVPNDRTLVQRYRKEGESCETSTVTAEMFGSAAPKFDPEGAVKWTHMSIERRFCHSGDLGDIISSLPAVRAIGGGEYVITDTRDGQRGSMRDRFASLKPLLECQPYIRSVEWQDRPTGITHDFRGFRANRDRRQSLAENHAQQVRTDIRLDPWLEVGEVEQHGRVVFARSSRYQNPHFPWTELAKHYGSKAVFVGLEAEHQEFQKVIGRSIGRHFTPDLLVLARVIAGASLVITGQSLPFWIAAGLGVPLIQSVWEADPNSIVPYPGALYPRGLNSKSKAIEFLLTTL